MIHKSRRARHGRYASLAAGCTLSSSGGAKITGKSTGRATKILSNLPLSFLGKVEKSRGRNFGHSHEGQHADRVMTTNKLDRKEQRSVLPPPPTTTATTIMATVPPLDRSKAPLDDPAAPAALSTRDEFVMLDESDAGSPGSCARTKAVCARSQSAGTAKKDAMSKMTKKTTVDRGSNGHNCVCTGAKR